MELSILIKIIIIFFLLLFSGFFSGSETAMFSLSLMQRERIKRSGNKRAVLIEKLLSQPKRLIITILMGNDLVNIAASVFATYLFVSLIGEYGKWATIAIMTPLTLIFAEIIPKTFCVAHNERVAPFVSGPLYLFSRLIAPLRWIFNESANLIIKFSGFEKRKAPPAIMEDDFRDMVDISHEDGELKKMEKELIHNVFEFSDTNVFEVMTPLDKIFCLTEDMDIETIITRVKDSHFSRIPVRKKNINDITGILYVKDLLKIKIKKISSETKPFPKICRKPFFIQETTKIDELFYILKQKHTHIAICLNKQGKVSGLVTMEDLLEELFGEIYDEHDTEDAG